MSRIVREPVKILFHLNEGFTRVLIEWTLGLGLADGGIEYDIPTSLIPSHLRKIGSRFILITNNIDYKSMIIEEIQTDR